MNSGALQASHRSEEENGTYDNIPTKIAGKCGFILLQPANVF